MQGGHGLISAIDPVGSMGVEHRWMAHTTDRTNSLKFKRVLIVFNKMSEAHNPPGFGGSGLKIAPLSNAARSCSARTKQLSQLRTFHNH
eukprot:2484505-Pyramimonas_sp.AAC.1